MKPFQFIACRRENGQLIELDIKTPIVTAETITEAINHPDIKTFCEQNNCTIYKLVGK